MIIPLVIKDLFITFTCFSIYGIKKSTPIRLHHVWSPSSELFILIEKLHRTSCAYGSGMIGYINEIIARTEQYFCPIKYATKLLGRHARYAHFLDFGSAEDYQKNLNLLMQHLVEFVNLFSCNLGGYLKSLT